MSGDSALPKVLIYGETFKKNGGGGITLNTLFGDWPTDNIFMLIDRFGETSEVHFNQYYQLGHLENKSLLHKLGFNTGNRSGSYEVNVNITEKTITTQNNSLFKNNLYFKLKSLFVSILKRVALYDLFFQFSVSDQLIQWVKKINPDIIYFQPSTDQNIRFINELHQVTGIPYVIHVMDNFLEVSNLVKGLNAKTNALIEQSVEQLVENSNLCMGICDEMCYQYGKKFGRTFYPFQHAVDSRFWYKIM